LGAHLASDLLAYVAPKCKTHLAPYALSDEDTDTLSYIFSDVCSVGVANLVSHGGAFHRELHGWSFEWRGNGSRLWWRRL